ncbi:MAG TPA: transcription termination factor NusA [Bacillota bacterium]|nr:transcription termination factor NusA [Bacillota bacterium]NMD33915.1 transcription termination/antitermination protein NusA [Bacillota bacterium]HOB29397.1 transcription termination factor NusA [Bacillota bacterium]HPZ42008.1 transcription termination factor NusA [Bacillota bacterium]HQD52911.1 transcription termination factor NusA [Bacillota bacterium]
MSVDSKELIAALKAIERDKGIELEVLFEALEVALVSAYKRNYQAPGNVRVNVDRETGEIKVFSQLKVVEEVEFPQQEIELYEARVYDSSCQLGDLVEKEVAQQEFGRIAAQTAKQVIIQRIREAERELIYKEFLERVEDITTGTVRRFEHRNVIVDLGKVEGILPQEEQLPRERYRMNERIKAFIMEVKKSSKGPQVILSRSHPGFLKRLFELEVPEIYDGIVEIKAAAREPGYRAKLAVHSNHKDVDPVGACVGPRGNRVQAISNELRGERIDVIRWSEEPEQYLANALSPAKVVSVELDEKSALVIVPDNQLSLAIGKEGQNARLAAKITGFKIDICSETQIAQKRLFSLGLANDDDEASPPEEPDAMPGEPALEIEDKADENLPEIEADEAEEVPEDSLEEK